MTNEEELQAHVKSGKMVCTSTYQRRMPAPPVVCADGYKMSVQASESHYCEPRDFDGPYSHVEVWNCSGVEEAFAPWEDSEGSPYAFVPIEAVLYVINKHGGFKDD